MNAAFAALLSATATMTMMDARAIPARTTQVDLYPIEMELMRLTNAERIRYGLAPLALDEALVRSARRHAKWMTINRSLQHTTASVGENIALGQRNGKHAIASWMASPGHRANILNTNYRKIGVAAFVATDGSIYWCQQFLR